MNMNTNSNSITITNNDSNFIGYEYREIAVDREMESAYIDGYSNFGWKLEGSDSVFGISTVNLKFKRDRKIRNKAELTRLQRQFESNLKEIEKLEQSKTTAAFTIAMTVGLIGTAFLAGATFAFIYAAMIPLMILLAVPGFIGWAMPYRLYKKIQANRNAKILPLIEQHYDSIYEVCEKAHGLLG